MNSHNKSLNLFFLLFYCAQHGVPLNAAQKSKEREAILNCLASNIRNSDGEIYDENFIEIFNRENVLSDINTTFNDYMDERNTTLLTLAVFYQRLSIVNFLILKGADLTISSSKGTSLECAIKKHWGLVEMLVSAGALFAYSVCEDHLQCYETDCFKCNPSNILNSLDNEQDKKTCAEVIARGEKEYEQRWKFYKSQVMHAIDQELGIRDLSHICVDYLKPDMILPENPNIEVIEAYFK